MSNLTPLLPCKVHWPPQCLKSYCMTSWVISGNSVSRQLWVVPLKCYCCRWHPRHKLLTDVSQQRHKLHVLTNVSLQSCCWWWDFYYWRYWVDLNQNQPYIVLSEYSVVNYWLSNDSISLRLNSIFECKLETKGTDLILNLNMLF